MGSRRVDLIDEPRADASAVAADPIALAEALAKALGHNQKANEVGEMEHEANITRKLGGWRKAVMQ